METVVHQFANRFPTEQFFRIPIEQKIDTARMNAEVIRLCEKHAAREAIRNRLMSVAGNEDRDVLKFGSQCHDTVGKIIATGARLQSQVTGEHNRICPFTPCFCYRAANGLDGL